jgi:hypothetical protein
MEPQYRGYAPVLDRHISADHNLMNKESWMLHKARVEIYYDMLRTGLCTPPMRQEDERFCRCSSCVIYSVTSTASKGMRNAALKAQMKLV